MAVGLPFVYSLLLAIIYLAFISLGLPDSLAGAGWPVMHGDLGVPVSFAGILTMIIAAGTIASSLQSDRLTRRFGAGLITAVSVAMTAAALFGFSLSGSFWLLCVWAVPYGLGAGAVDAALNNYVALHYSSKHMNWLHCFWGVGASISPFIMSHAITQGQGWPAGYRTVGIIQVVLVALLFLTLPLWGKVNQAPTGHLTEDDRGEPARPLGIAGTLRLPGAPMLLIAFFAYCAAEGTFMLWSATYLVEERGVAPATAAAFASLFLLGITAGRFLGGFVADRLGDRQLIRIGIATVAVGVTLIALPLENDVPALAGLVIAGLGSAPIYPAIIHSTPANFGRENSQAVIGIQMASAYLGMTLMPPLFGALSGWLGLWLLPLYAALLVTLMLVMSEWLNRIVARRGLVAVG
ncbi:MAG: MFS transporter [Nigerium sp.]|nr:MFS transporter [Nigerium sp.]